MIFIQNILLGNMKNLNDPYWIKLLSYAVES